MAADGPPEPQRALEVHRVARRQSPPRVVRASVSGPRSKPKPPARRSTTVRQTPFTAMLAPTRVPRARRAAPPTAQPARRARRTHRPHLLDDAREHVTASRVRTRRRRASISRSSPDGPDIDERRAASRRRSAQARAPDRPVGAPRRRAAWAPRRRRRGRRGPPRGTPSVSSPPPSTSTAGTSRANERGPEVARGPRAPRATCTRSTVTPARLERRHARAGRRVGAHGDQRAPGLAGADQRAPSDGSRQPAVDARRATAPRPGAPEPHGERRIVAPARCRSPPGWRRARCAAGAPRGAPPRR